MSETIQGIFAGYVLSRTSGGLLASDDERHCDVTLLGVQENGGYSHSMRGLLPRGTAATTAGFSLSGISSSTLPGTMPTCRTGLNGGFCVLYEFEATRLAVDFSLSTRIRFRASLETAMTETVPGILWSGSRITGWRMDNIGVADVPAFTVPNFPNLQDIITYMTAQRDQMNDFASGILDVITEDTIASTVSSAIAYGQQVTNPNARQILFSIAVIRI